MEWGGWRSRYSEHRNAWGEEVSAEVSSRTFKNKVYLSLNPECRTPDKSLHISEYSHV